MSEPNEEMSREVTKLDAARHKGEALVDFERFLLFMAVINPAMPQVRTQEGLIKLFCRITGWEESRAVAAFDACAIKGYIYPGEKL